MPKRWLGAPHYEVIDMGTTDCDVTDFETTNVLQQMPNTAGLCTTDLNDKVYPSLEAKAHNNSKNYTRYSKSQSLQQQQKF